MKTMKKHNVFIIKFLKNYEEQCPGIINDWCSIDNQEQFHKLRHMNNNREKRRCTCYILFCLKRRPELKEQHPYLPNTKITSMLANEWREHRDKKDDVYMQFKEADRKQVFLKTYKNEICERYPHLSDHEVNTTLDKMYEKYTKK
jgi:hypothetical protein